MMLLAMYDEAIGYVCSAGRMLCENNQQGASRASSMAIGVMANLLRAMAGIDDSNLQCDAELTQALYLHYGRIIRDLDVAMEHEDLDMFDNVLDAMHHSREIWCDVRFHAQQREQGLAAA